MTTAGQSTGTFQPAPTERPSLRLLRPAAGEQKRRWRWCESPYQQSPAAVALAAEMQELDGYIHAHDLTGGRHTAYRRDFYCRSAEADADWTLGGRFYSTGQDSYQSLTPPQRTAMRIDGESVAEIDVVASSLTIYACLAGQPVDLSKDPYTVSFLPRRVTKAWIVDALKIGRLPDRWPPRTSNRIKRAYGLDLVQRLILRAHPVLGSIAGNGLSDLDLQYHESAVVLAAMLELKRQHDIVSLNMHDGIIVRRRDAERARQVFATAFHARLGTGPRLRLRTSDDPYPPRPGWR